MKKIIFATGNKSKIEQLKFVAKFIGINQFEFIPGKELYKEKADYPEIGESVEEVASNGINHIAKNFPGEILITEDSDFRIDALEGLPGIRAGELLKKFGRQEILNRMNGIKKREAQLNSAVALILPDGKTKVFVNTVKGHIAFEEKYGDYPDWISPNENFSFGGGYNAIVIPEGWNKTLAEISLEEAMPWSYRERNFVDLLEYLKEVV